MDSCCDCPECCAVRRCAAARRHGRPLCPQYAAQDRWINTRTSLHPRRPLCPITSTSDPPESAELAPNIIKETLSSNDDVHITHLRLPKAISFRTRRHRESSPGPHRLSSRHPCVTSQRRPFFMHKVSPSSQPSTEAQSTYQRGQERPSSFQAWTDRSTPSGAIMRAHTALPGTQTRTGSRKAAHVLFGPNCKEVNMAAMHCCVLLPLQNLGEAQKKFDTQK